MDEKQARVGVLLADLEDMRDALDTARYQNFAFDMFDMYRQQNNRGNASPITKRLERALSKANFYLPSPKEEPDEKPLP